MNEALPGSVDTANDYYSFSRPEIGRLVPPGARRLLDVGCAEGHFGAALKAKRAGLEVWGIEPVTDVASRAARRLDRVIAAPAENALNEVPDGYFDCISLNDCLEHLIDPWSVLRKLEAKLSADGCIVASLPNLRFFPVMSKLIGNADFSYEDAGVLDRTHLRFFTRSGMRDLFSNTGYSIEHMAGIHAIRLPFWVSQISKLFGRRFHDMEFQQFAIRATPNRSQVPTA